ncbi:hypothetical protein B0H16DRAFT_1470315 [Mycena metata]|uniref:Uncharacterized protein n=1 Tax=Mycena metata TaxID=1033252 RepID=A0AAD7HW79_9AGAR|nr:hypothetical protein B0H16DRAFT_1470315 [Mycena metata]
MKTLRRNGTVPPETPKTPTAPKDRQRKKKSTHEHRQTKRQIDVETTSTSRHRAKTVSTKPRRRRPVSEKPSAPLCSTNSSRLLGSSASRALSAPQAASQAASPPKKLRRHETSLAPTIAGSPKLDRNTTPGRRETRTHRRQSSHRNSRSTHVFPPLEKSTITRPAAKTYDRETSLLTVEKRYNPTLIPSSALCLLQQPIEAPLGAVRGRAAEV